MRNPDQSQQFNTTLIIAMILAAILACGIVFMVYGCERAHQLPVQNRAHQSGYSLTASP